MSLDAKCRQLIDNKNCTHLPNQNFDNKEVINTGRVNDVDPEQMTRVECSDTVLLVNVSSSIDLCHHLVLNVNINICDPGSRSPTNRHQNRYYLG